MTLRIPSTDASTPKMMFIVLSVERPRTLRVLEVATAMCSSVLVVEVLRKLRMLRVMVVNEAI